MSNKIPRIHSLLIQFSVTEFISYFPHLSVIQPPIHPINKINSTKLVLHRKAVRFLQRLGDGNKIVLMVIMVKFLHTVDEILDHLRKPMVLSSSRLLLPIFWGKGFK